MNRKKAKSEGYKVVIIGLILILMVGGYYFYLSNKNTEHLDLIMIVLRKKDKDLNEAIYETLKEYILKNTYKLMEAKSFLNKIML